MFVAGYEFITVSIESLSRFFFYLFVDYFFKVCSYVEGEARLKIQQFKFTEIVYVCVTFVLFDCLQ